MYKYHVRAEKFRRNLTRKPVVVKMATRLYYILDKEGLRNNDFNVHNSIILGNMACSF